MRYDAAFLSLLLAGGLAAATAVELAATESARQTIAEWVQTRRVLSEEESAWRQEEQVVRQSIALLEEETELLTAKLSELNANRERATREKEALGEKKEAFLAVSAEAGELVTALEEELQALRPALPPALEAEAGPLFSRLDEAGARSIALSQRFQTVLGILAEVNSFQRNVTLLRETRELDDGTRREMRTLYLGLAYAFFVDDHERIAGSGRPTASGWEWARNDAIAPAVARAVAVLQNQQPAEFIDLPVEVAK